MEENTSNGHDIEPASIDIENISPPNKKKITSIFAEYSNKIKKKKDYSIQKNDATQPILYKKITNKLGLSKIGQIFIGILIISMLAELIFFGAIKRDSSIQIEDFESKITTANAAIESARGVKRNSSDLTGKERIDIETSVKVDLAESIGARIDTVVVDEKIPKPGSQSVYYKVKLQYAAKDLDSLKTLAAIVYLNPYVLKITNIDSNYIYVIMTNTKIEEEEL